MIYEVNSPIYRQFLSDKATGKKKADASKGDASAGKQKGATKDRGMAHPSSVGC